MRLPSFILLLLPLLIGCSVERPAPVTAPPPSRPTVRVDVWHDTVCPWCRIGLHNLETAAASFTTARVEIVHHPFLLEPDAPPEGADLRERLGKKFGPEQLDAMFQRVSAAGAPYGVRFNWDAVRLSPNTTASHALIDWAPTEKRGAVVAAIHAAHFEEGRNLGEATVLAAIARSAGLDETAARAAVTDPSRLAAVRQSAAQASQRSITGVPYFEIGGQALRGAQGPEALRAAMQAAALRTAQ